MSTDTTTTLPERDYLHMEIALSAVEIRSEISLRPTTRYRLIFRINLQNTTSTSVRLLGRKWLLREQKGLPRIIEAQNVFNEQPIIEPGSIFGLSGCHDFNTPPTHAELRLFGIDQTNTPFITPPLLFPKRALKAR